MAIDRRKFCEGLGGSTALLFLAACGGGGSGSGSYMSPAPAPMPPPPPGPVTSCSAITITGNHGHSLVIPVADLNSMVDMTYNIQGTADHNHTITLTPVQLGQIKGRMAATVISSIASSMTTSSHSHDVTSNCS
jgi:hypothetical protein